MVRGGGQLLQQRKWLRFASRQLFGPQALDLLLSAPLLPTWACPGPQVEGWLRHQALPPQQNDFHQNIYTIAGNALPPPHQTLSGYRSPKYRVYINIEIYELIRYWSPIYVLCV